MGKVGEFEFSVKVKQLSIEDRLKRFRGSLSGVRWFKTTKGGEKGIQQSPALISCITRHSLVAEPTAEIPVARRLPT